MGLKYELEDYPPYAAVAITVCPYYKYKTIGSYGCITCKYHKTFTKETMTVQCVKDEEKVGKR